MSNKGLVVDLNPGEDIPYAFDFTYKSGDLAINIHEWDFSDEFGVLEKAILNEVSETIAAIFKDSLTLTLDISQLNTYHEEPASPLAVKVKFSFGVGPDEITYEHSLDEVIAIEFHSQQTIDGTYNVEFTKRATKFRDALRELADKIDAELQRGTEA